MRLRPRANLNDRAGFVHGSPAGLGIAALSQGPNDGQIVIAVRFVTVRSKRLA
jgi:hypothetical protein